MRYLKILIVCLFFSASICNAKNNTLYDYLIKPLPENHPWGILIYWGETLEETLSQIVYHARHTRVGEHLYSIELSRTFYRNYWGKFQIAGNMANRFASPSKYHNPYPVPEIDLYLMMHYTAFPWNRWINTSLAIGEGVSYTATIPFPEKEKRTAKNSKQLLDFMVFEITLALPTYPQWQLVGRFHHRSAAYGLFAPRDYHAGSNTVGLGIRYVF